MVTINQEFEENGFIIQEKALDDDEISELKDKLDTVYSQVIANVGADPKSFHSLEERYAFLHDVHPEMKSRAYDLTKLLDVLWKCAVKEKIIGTIRSIIGNEVLIGAPQVRIDDPKNERLLPLHQEGLRQISDNTITAWIPLQDVNPEVGTLAIEAQSHKRGYLPGKCYADRNNYYGVCEEHLNPDKVELLEISKGDAVIFHPRLIHGSARNPSTTTRWTFVARYNDITNIPYIQDLKAPLQPE